MKIEEGRVDGDITVDEDFVLNGAVSGNIVVISGGSLELNGTCEGDLTLEPDTTVRINGLVGGDIHNLGGKLEITGVLHGTLHEA
jgi:cytoskeletal protein CcmA (bactofilin family)